MRQSPPYPSTMPVYNSKRLARLLRNLGNTSEQKYVKIMYLLGRFGKLDELSDMLEQYFNHKEELVESGTEYILRAISNQNPENEVTIT